MHTTHVTSQKTMVWDKLPEHYPATIISVPLSHPETTIAAAAAAMSLQSCPTLCDPIEGSPPGSPVPGILQARTLEWVAISFSIKDYVRMPLLLNKLVTWQNGPRKKNGTLNCLHSV